MLAVILLFMRGYKIPRKETEEKAVNVFVDEAGDSIIQPECPSRRGVEGAEGGS